MMHGFLTLLCATAITSERRSDDPVEQSRLDTSEARASIEFDAFGRERVVFKSQSIDADKATQWSDSSLAEVSVADSGASSNAELLALQRIDEAATQLQQQGNYLGALECLERGLVLRQHFFGAESDEV